MADGIEDLLRENATLTEQNRVLTVQIASLSAQIDELRAAPANPDKIRWWGYKSSKRKGAFDMLEVSHWEGVEITTTGTTQWIYSIYFRDGKTVVLDATQFNDFARVFDAYLSR